MSFIMSLGRLTSWSLAITILCHVEVGAQHHTDDTEKLSLACAFGNGVPVKQPPTDDGLALTCNPPAKGGASGTVELNADDSANLYHDAQLFSYPYPPLTLQEGSGLINVAVLGLGADGGCGGKSPPKSPEDRVSRIMGYIKRAGEKNVDLAVLPENAFGRPGEGPNCLIPGESITGPTVTAVAALANQYHMNVILPIHELRGTKSYNTAVVINRNGSVVGTYSKVFPVFGNLSQTWDPPQNGSGAEISPPDSVSPSSEGVKVFDLDIGRIAVLICFDINFAELWHQAAGLGADIVVWPSAMKTPDPSSYGYARIHQYDIIACGYPGEVVDRTGAPSNRSFDTDFPMMTYSTLNIDRTFVHWDYNSAKVTRLLAENPSVVKEVEGPPFYLLRSTVPEISVRKLLKSYNIETNREYVQRSRRGLNLLRKNSQ